MDAALFTKGAIATQDGEKSTGNIMFCMAVMGSLRTVDSVTGLRAAVTKIYSRAKVSIARCGGNRWGRVERSCSTLRDRRNGRRSRFEVSCKPLRRNTATNSGSPQPIFGALSVHLRTRLCSQTLIGDSRARAETPRIEQKTARSIYGGSKY